MSKRFALKRFLGLTDEELAENERLWSEESGKGMPTATDSSGELRGAGLSAGGIANDMSSAEDMSAPEGMEGLEEPGAAEQGAAPPVGMATPTPTV
jgi:hypothetical protein